MNITDFSRKELLDAADMFMDNMKQNAMRLSATGDRYAMTEKYLKAIAYDDFEDKMLYGIVFGEKYDRPEEYEKKPDGT